MVGAGRRTCIPPRFALNAVFGGELYVVQELDTPARRVQVARATLFNRIGLGNAIVAGPLRFRPDPDGALFLRAPPAESVARPVLPCYDAVTVPDRSAFPSNLPRDNPAQNRDDLSNYCGKQHEVALTAVTVVGATMRENSIQAPICVS